MLFYVLVFLLDTYYHLQRDLLNTVLGGPVPGHSIPCGFSSEPSWEVGGGGPGAGTGAGEGRGRGEGARGLLGDCGSAGDGEFRSAGPAGRT